MRVDINYLENLYTKLLIKKIITDLIVLFVVLFIMIYGAKYLLTKEISNFITFKFVTLLDIIIIIGVGISKTKKGIKINNHMLTIESVKNSENPYLYFKQGAIDYKGFMEIKVKHIENLKTFTPVPLVLYSVGLYINKNSELSTYITIFNINTSIINLVMGIAIALLIFFIALVLIFQSEYEDFYFFYREYEKNSLVYDKK